VVLGVLVACSVVLGAGEEGDLTPASGLEGAVLVSTPTYLSLMTVAITIIGVAIGVFGSLTLFGAQRTLETARRDADDLSEARSGAAKEMEAWKGKMEQATREIEVIRRQIDRYAHSVRQSAGAFHPSGEFLSTRTLALLDEPGGDVKTAEECLTSLRSVVQGLAQAFLANAQYGKQIQKLYTGDKKGVLTSVAYLSEMPATHSLAVLEDRLVLERASERPDVDLAVSLELAIREMRRTLANPEP
jgi:hypothetical protein